MKKQKKHKKQIVYTTNTFKLAVGIVGIILFLGILLSLDTLIGAPTNGDTSTDDTTKSAQTIKMAVDGVSYFPSSLTVEVGKPVKWIVDGTKSIGCTQYLISPELGISKKLAKGENIIEFTPQKKGSFRFQCSMNMVSGTMNVI